MFKLVAEGQELIDFGNNTMLLTFWLSVVFGVIPYIYAEELVILFKAQGADVIAGGARRFRAIAREAA